MQFSAQGPLTFEEAPELALLVSGYQATVLHLRTLHWTSTVLNHSTLVAGAVVPTTTLDSEMTSLRVLVGGHSVSHPYGPVVFNATLTLQSSVKNHSTEANIVYDFDAENSPSMRRMSVSSLVRSNESQALVVAGLHVGDYYDGDLPMHLWATKNDGKDWCVLDEALPNTLVDSMAFAPDGRLCVSTSGDGVLCFNATCRGRQNNWLSS